MSIRFHNTLTRQTEDFVPMEPGKVRLYTCGPTVYNFAHIGNFRAYVFEDLLHRYLEFRGLDVTQIMNLTDVDDKTIKGAIAQKVPLKEFTKPFIEAFFADLERELEKVEFFRPPEKRGVMQVNLKIPPSARTGELPIVVSVGGTPTQSGVTISVR